MLTREVRLWLDKVKQGSYSYENAMYEFANFSPILTIEEIKFLKARLEETCKKQQ